MVPIKYIYSYRHIWEIAYPILISLIMEQLVGMTDTAFLGRVGEVELGASAIAGVYYMVLHMIGFGFSVGAQIIIARRNGEKEFKETGNVFYHGIFFLLALCLGIILISELVSPWIMSAIVSSEHIRTAALDYVRFRLPGLLFAYMTAMFRSFYIGTVQTKTLSLNSVIMVVSNVVFNWILIFGKGDIPALGIKGAAIGSTLAELVSLMFFVIYTPHKTDCRKYGLNCFEKFSYKKLKDILSVSVWTMILNVVSLSTWLIFFVSIEHLGERSLAVSNIVRSIAGLLWMVMMAFASTCSSLVSNLIGSGHPELVQTLVRRVLKISYGVTAVMILLVVCFPEMFIRIYTDLPDLIAESKPALMVLCASYVVTVPANVFFQSVAGTGNTRISFFLEMISLIFYMAYCFLVINLLKSSIAVCWTSEIAYGLPMMILSYLYLASGRWRGKAV